MFADYIITARHIRHFCLGGAVRVMIQFYCIPVYSVVSISRGVHTCMTLHGGDENVQLLCILFILVILCVLKCQVDC